MPDRWQVVQIENPIDTLKILEKHFAGASSKSRLMVAPGGNFVMLEMKPDQTLTVSQISSQMYINHKGDLEPLNPLVQLHYTPRLDLEFQKVHYVEVAPTIFARFMILGTGMTGNLIRGYTFQKAEEFKGGGVNQYAQVYYAIKRLEQLFVDRKSDPMYQELTKVLEKAVELVNMRHPESVTFAQAALERGESALENIFINDNMIRLLTQTLRSSLQNSRNAVPSRQSAQSEIPWKNDQLLVE